MTVIAFDGKTVAADRRAVHAGVCRTTTKITRHKNMIIGCAGDVDIAQSLFYWAKQGFNPETFPDMRGGELCASTIVIQDDGTIWLIERTPHHIEYHDPFFAIGSGRDFAMAAMALGKSAKEAVELACQFDVGCGNGVDVLELQP